VDAITAIARPRMLVRIVKATLVVAVVESESDEMIRIRIRDIDNETTIGSELGFGFAGCNQRIRFDTGSTCVRSIG
jgi:hypothetical protein